MTPDTPSRPDRPDRPERTDRPDRSDDRAGAQDSGDKYLDAIHEVAGRERGARRERAEAQDEDLPTPRETGAWRPKAEDESADPVGDGHSDADYAKKLPEDQPGGSRTGGKG